MKRLFLLLAVLTLPASLSADVRLPALLADHMVLQRDQPIHIWGWAGTDEKVTVTLNGKSASDGADAAGRWSVYLAPESAGGPHELTVAGKNKITLKDILIGDVWVGSGQSNMAWTVRRSTDADKEIAAAKYPKMRLFQVKLETADEPKDDVEGSWKACSPESVADFSAVGYFFSRHLQEKTGVPIGFVQSAWGGTPAESWTTEETLAGDPSLNRFLEEWRQVEAAYPREEARFRQQLAEWEKEATAARRAGNDPPARPREPRGPGHPHQPASLYNAMIAPLTPFPIRGAIWYQGENNANRPDGGDRYLHLFRTMIEDWRRVWGVGDFPFLFVQLANYARPDPTTQWPELREAQTKTLSLVKTGMAVTIDIGESEDIHPKNKQDVGLRLALAARAISHGERDLVYSGPIYRQMSTETGKIRLWFDHVGGGLVARGGSLKGFEVAGADGRFHSADARVDGKTVVVSSAKVADPVAARYAWERDPTVSLFNKEGLPASPFRTDDWSE